MVRHLLVVMLVDLLILWTGWSVNFNTALEFFEPSVAALRNLMDLALLSPREQPTRLLFVSSIGVVARAFEPTL